MNPRFLRDQAAFEAPFFYRFADAEPFLRSAVAAARRRALGVCHSETARHNAAIAASNCALRTIGDRLKVNDLNLSWNDESIRLWADNKASKCARLVRAGEKLEKLQRFVESYGLQWPRSGSNHHSAIARIVSDRWWRRQVKVLQRRTIDQTARDLRLVHRKGEVYCADWTVKQRESQKRQNRALLESLGAISDEGDVYTLAELSDLSTSKPDIRRGELMVRIRGFEEVAQQQGDVGLFYTITTPSRFHPMRTGKGGSVIDNPAYSGATPRDAQVYLNEIWSQARAKLSRSGIRCYGFRVAEPHHDGTPHWHLMLFAAPDQHSQLTATLRHYALQESPREPGAQKHRFTVVTIDPAKGTAAGYIAKYIAKNIDGYRLGIDFEADTHQNTSSRVEAWASTWGIRQFQQIGGPSVTVWRELRRLDADDLSGDYEATRKAADTADWAAFVLLMGGPTVRRDSQPIRCARWLEHDAQTGECIDAPFNLYGELNSGRLFGLCLSATSEYVITRARRWAIDHINRLTQVRRSVSEEWDELWRITGTAFLASGPPLATLDLCQ
ncbi:MAG TPA: replication endonuclease [Spongiibacteraceae bacterium]|nr:replication protein A [Spongiibacteraceae bacterium]HCS28658.1 replication endonuclease [Spongiibacteraceae bacterium]